MSLAQKHNAIAVKNIISSFIIANHKFNAFQKESNSKWGIRTMTEAIAPYVVSSFSGADMTILLNSNIIGDTQKVVYHERLEKDNESQLGFYGEIEVAIFNEEPKIRGIVKKDKPNYEMLILFQDEYGNQMSVKYEDMVFKKRTGSFDIDNIVPIETYMFECKNITFDTRRFTVNQSEIGKLEIDYIE